jgi:hypothetical protein
MQCSSCRFENMPGVEVCGRCGSSLRLATAVLDVHPPRARPWVKRLRRALPISRASVGVRDAASEVRRQLRRGADELRVPVPEWALLARLVVPGWSHFRCGQRMRGRIFLGLYLALLLPGLLFWGSMLGSILLGLAFSVHASAALDIALQTPKEFPSRVFTTLAVTAALSLGLYVPAGWLLTRVADPRNILETATPLEEGDVVLVNHLAYRRSRPRLGDVVLLHIESMMFPAQGNRPAMAIPAGEIIDRVLAGPGDEVIWENQQLRVNGSPSDLLPLNPERLALRLKIRVPENHYLVLPTTVPRLDRRATTAMLQSVSSVPAEQILGRAYLRHQPLWRWWWIR